MAGNIANHHRRNLTAKQNVLESCKTLHKILMTQKSKSAVHNLFIHKSAAERYAAARPYFHPLVMRRIISSSGISHFSHALDVACGTGQSSRALADIADQVKAIDISPAMVAMAESHENIQYQVAPAEEIPFPDSSFELVTVGLAYHWFDQAKFLREAHRVLKADSWLAIYTSGFLGEMLEDPSFSKWAQKTYPEKFPTPPRYNTSVAVNAIEPFGFILQNTEKFTHNEIMTAEGLTYYLSSQTNVIAAVENGTVPLEAATNWILSNIQPFFKSETRTMKFGGSISLLQRKDLENC